MAQPQDRTDARDDLPEEVQHPNRTGPSGPSLAIGLAIVAVLMIALAVAVTVG